MTMILLAAVLAIVAFVLLVRIQPPNKGTTVSTGNYWFQQSHFPSYSLQLLLPLFLLLAAVGCVAWEVCERLSS